MLRPAQAVRTLILPYADRNRPDRLYMSRFVYSVLETPSWVVGGYLVPLVSAAARVPVLEQLREVPGSELTPPVVPARAEPRPCRPPEPAVVLPRSQQRRVLKECARPCRYRCSSVP